MEQKQAGSSDTSMNIALAVIFVIELLLLVPWYVFSVLGIMAFDTGFSWGAVIIATPLWSYPLLVIIFGIVSARYAGLRKHNIALITILLPVIVPFVCYVFISAYYSIPTKEYLEAKNAFNEKCELAKDIIYKEPNIINGVYFNYKSPPSTPNGVDNYQKAIKYPLARSDVWKLTNSGLIKFFETRNSEERIANGEKNYRRYYGEHHKKQGYIGEDVGELLSEYGIYTNRIKSKKVHNYYINGGTYKIVDLKSNEVVAETSFYGSSELNMYCGNGPKGSDYATLLVMNLFKTTN